MPFGKAASTWGLHPPLGAQLPPGRGASHLQPLLPAVMGAGFSNFGLPLVLPAAPCWAVLLGWVMDREGEREILTSPVTSTLRGSALYSLKNSQLFALTLCKHIFFSQIEPLCQRAMQGSCCISQAGELLQEWCDSMEKFKKKLPIIQGQCLAMKRHWKAVT